MHYGEKDEMYANVSRTGDMKGMRIDTILLRLKNDLWQERRKGFKNALESSFIMLFVGFVFLRNCPCSGQTCENAS